MLETDIELLERGIYDELPQSDYVIDKVGEVVKYVKEYYSENEAKLASVLRRAHRSAHYATKISEEKMYKTRIVIGTLLYEIPDILTSEDFKKFDSASGHNRKMIDTLCIKKDVVNKGCFRTLTNHLIAVGRADSEALYILLLGILDDLQVLVEGMKKVKEKSPITAEDYITVLGYSNVLKSLKVAVDVTGYPRSVLAEILEILSTEIYF